MPPRFRRRVERGAVSTLMALLLSVIHRDTPIEEEGNGSYGTSARSNLEKRVAAIV